MAADSKTIDQLPSKETLNDNDMFPVDDGEQTYKVLFSKIYQNVPGITNIELSQDGQSIIVTPRTGQPITITTHDNTKQNTLTFDNAPTNGSNNPAKSGGIYTAIQTVAQAIVNEAQTARDTEGALANRLTAAEGTITSQGTAIGSLQTAVNTKMTTATYDSNGNGVVDNAEKVGGHSVNKDVPSDAKFTDTVYNDAELRGKIGDLSALDTENASDLVSAINELVSDFASVDEEVDKLSAFSGSETILDSSGGEILDSSNNRILDTQVGAAGVVVALRNVLTWFKTNASHLVQDSGYTVNKATYELINS